jgi:hypothetical protein
LRHEDRDGGRTGEDGCRRDFARLHARRVRRISGVDPETKTALAKANESPKALRRYVHRTRAIYRLNYYDVVAIRHALVAREAVPAVAEKERR